MPSEITSMPASRFAATLRSSSANRYGGIRSRRSLGCIQVPFKLFGQLAPVYRHCPAAQVDVQVLPHVDLQLAAVEADGDLAVAPAQNMGDGRAAGPGAGGH